MMRNIFLIVLLLMLNACGDITGDTTGDNNADNSDSSDNSTYTDYGDGTVTKCDDGNCTVYLLDENYYEYDESNGTNIS